jgi:hypothetical protein
MVLRSQFLGFFISGELQLDKDPDPSAIGMYRLKDAVYNDMKQNPIRPYQTANGFGFDNAAAFYTNDDFDKVDNKENVISWAIVLQQNWTFNRWIIPPLL